MAGWLAVSLVLFLTAVNFQGRGINGRRDREIKRWTDGKVAATDVIWMDTNTTDRPTLTFFFLCV